MPHIPYLMFDGRKAMILGWWLALLLIVIFLLMDAIVASLPLLLVLFGIPFLIAVLARKIAARL